MHSRGPAEQENHQDVESIMEEPRAEIEIQRGERRQRPSEEEGRRQEEPDPDLLVADKRGDSSIAQYEEEQPPEHDIGPRANAGTEVKRLSPVAFQFLAAVEKLIAADHQAGRDQQQPQDRERPAIEKPGPATEPGGGPDQHRCGGDQGHRLPREPALQASDGLEGQFPAGPAPARAELLGGMDDHLLLFLGDLDDRLALRAGTAFPRELIADLKLLLAAGTDDRDRHATYPSGGGEQSPKRSLPERAQARRLCFSITKSPGNDCPSLARHAKA